MMNAKEYLPVGSVVLLKNGIKKAVIIGIMQEGLNKDGEKETYDYIGVLYPEGFLNTKTMFLFNHNAINDIIFRGYENPEREDMIRNIEEKRG